MAGVSREARPLEQRELFQPLISPGVARFMLAAQSDIIAKRAFDPDFTSMHRYPGSVAMREALGKSDVALVDTHLVDMLSTSLRAAVTEQKKGRGENIENQLTEWGAGMVVFLQKLSTTASPELQDLAKKQLGVDLAQTSGVDPFDQVEIMWNKYLAQGSNIESFLADLFSGIPDGTPTSMLEMHRRIALAEPFLGMFGDDRINVLVKDVGNAIALLRSDRRNRQEINELVLQTIRRPFSQEREKVSYQLLWEAIKDALPQDDQQGSTQHSHPQQEAAESSPPPTITPEQEQQEERQRVADPQVHQENAPAQQAPTAPKQTAQAPREEPAHSQEIVSPGPLTQAAAQGQNQDGKERAQHTLPRIAAMVARNPEKPWITGDAFIVREFADGGFVLGAFDAIEKGGSYSAGVARKIKQTVARVIGKNGQSEPIPRSVLEVIAALGQAKPFIERVKQGAEKELTELHITDERKKDITDHIGSTGLLAITAKSGDDTMLVAVNLGNARLVSYNPSTGEVKSLTQDHLAPDNLLKRGARILHSSTQRFLDAHTDNLSHWVQEKDIKALEERFHRQQRSGWSQTDEFLRVFPLTKGNLYILLTNGITLNIPPKEFSQVIENAYSQAKTPGGSVDVSHVVRSIVQEAHKRMRRPEQYRLSVRGNRQNYVVSDTAGAAAVLSI